MDFTSFLKKPNRLNILAGYLDIPDANTVKGAIETFNIFYEQSLMAICRGEANSEAFVECLPTINKIYSKIISILSSSTDMAIVTLTIKCLENIMSHHTTTELKHFPKIYCTASMRLRAGINSILSHIEMDNGMDCIFSVALKALINIALHQKKLLEILILKIRKFINKPSSSIYKNNVTSVKEILQTNMFLLLESAQNEEEGRHLAELLVWAGIPEIKLKNWLRGSKRRISDEDLAESRKKKLKQGSIIQAPQSSKPESSDMEGL